MSFLLKLFLLLLTPFLTGLGHSWQHYIQQLSPYPPSAVTEANGPPVLVYTRAAERTESIDGSASSIQLLRSTQCLVGIWYA